MKNTITLIFSGIRFVQLLIAFTLPVGAVSAQTPPPPPIKCDANGDRVIDQIDINIIKLSRNLPVTGANDPRDADSDGHITAADASICAKRCTRPLCSTINIPPTARAGPDQTVPLGEVVGLNGTASTDPEGSLLTYRWTITGRPAGSVSTLTSASVSMPTFNIDKPGSYTIQLIVNDGIADSAPDEVIVSSSNSRPRASAGIAQTVPLGSTVTLNGAGSSDPDGDPITYAWSFTTKPASSAAVFGNPASILPTFIADRPGTYVAQLLVNDTHFTSFPSTVSISTINSAPVALAGAAQTRLHGGTAVLDGAGSFDADGDPLTYLWALIGRPPGSTATLSSFTAVNPNLRLDVPGNYVAQLIVNDGKVNSAPSTITISDTNTAAMAVAGPNQSVAVGTTVTLDGSLSTDADLDPLTYKWSIISVPAGSQAVLNNPLLAKPTFVADIAGLYIVQLIVNDTFVDSVASNVMISANSANLPPVAIASFSGLNQPSNPNRGPSFYYVSCCQTVYLDGASSSDPEGASLTYSWSILSIQPANQTAVLVKGNTATPNFSAGCDCGIAITYVIQLIVSDGVQTSAPSTVTVRAENNTPFASAGADIGTGILNFVTSIQLDGSGSFDPDGDPLTYSWTLVSSPVNSTAALSNPTLMNPKFVADQYGLYVFDLVVSDGFTSSAAYPTGLLANLPPIPKTRVTINTYPPG